MHFIYELAVPMTQQLENTFRYGAGVHQAPQLGGSTSVTPAVAEQEDPKKSVEEESAVQEDAEIKSIEEESAVQEDAEKSIEEDRLKDAREKVREEITREFAALMTSGSLPASEAAALAARRVMERHGRINATTRQSC